MTARAVPELDRRAEDERCFCLNARRLLDTVEIKAPLAQMAFCILAGNEVAAILFGKADGLSRRFPCERYEHGSTIRFDCHILHFLCFHRVKDELAATAVDEARLLLAALGT